MKQKIGVVMLAAGLGKRMGSSCPKVLMPLCGQPLLFYPLVQVLKLFPETPVGIVVSHQREVIQLAVEAHFGKNPFWTWIDQNRPDGTGHAMQSVMKSEWGQDRLRLEEPILVLPGDQPLISEELLEAMVQPLPSEEVFRILTTEVPHPAGYGRVVRDQGKILRVVEDRDANASEKQITEVANSIYFFRSSFLVSFLPKLSNQQNVQKEYYLTDLVSLAQESGKKVGGLFWKAFEDVLGANHLWDLAQVEALLNQRLLKKWAMQGVRFMAPQTLSIEASVEIGSGTVLESGVVLRGKTKIGKNCVIRSAVVLVDATIEEGALIDVGTVIRSSKVHEGAQVGPYAHIRPESEIGPFSKVGNFVELKKTRIGSKTKVSHLSYLGDAEVGSHVNVGCGFITCNYDGREKHPTRIEDEVFIGSDCQVIAPIQIGKGAYLASGSTLTEDVEEGAFVIARSRQVTKLNYAKKYRFRSEEKQGG